MDTHRFIESAPTYYALAICVFFRDKRREASAGEIRAYHSFRIADGSGDPEDDTVYLLEKNLLFDKAMEWLSDRGMVIPLFDDFGPTIYKFTDRFDNEWFELCEDTNSPFYKYQTLRDGSDEWLRAALGKISAVYDELGITRDDFERPDDEWKPIPLERDDIRLKNAIVAIDETIELVRADNGYNATLPEERNYVLTALTNTAHTLKNAASTSVPYLRKFALEPLAILIRRFKDAAISIVATGAREALIEFVKEHVAKLLDFLS